jgi:hypothetical protein
MNTFIPPIFANWTELTHSLPHLMGFVFVLVVLALMWALLELTGSAFRMGAKRSQTLKCKTPLSPTPEASSARTGDTAEAELEAVIVISATVAALLGQGRHRLVSIKSPTLDWSREGRRQHILSHKLH